MAAAIRVIPVSPSTTAIALASALFLLTSAIAARRAIARGDADEAAFVAAVAFLVAALLAAVRAHDEAEGLRRRGLLRAVVWAVSAALTAMFARRVAAVVANPGVAAVVWTMAGATVVGGLCCLFVRGQEDDDGGVGHDARPA